MDKHKNLPNPEWSQAMADKRRSNATQPHEDKRTKRARSRAASKRAAIERDSE